MARTTANLAGIEVRRGDTLEVHEINTGSRYIGVVHGWKNSIRVYDGSRVRYYYPESRLEVRVIGRSSYLRQTPGHRTSDSRTYPN